MRGGRTRCADSEVDEATQRPVGGFDLGPPCPRRAGASRQRGGPRPSGRAPDFGGPRRAARSRAPARLVGCGDSAGSDGDPLVDSQGAVGMTLGGAAAGATIWAAGGAEREVRVSFAPLRSFQPASGSTRPPFRTISSERLGLTAPAARWRVRVAEGPGGSRPVTRARPRRTDAPPAGTSSPGRTFWPAAKRAVSHAGRVF